MQFLVNVTFEHIARAQPFLDRLRSNAIVDDHFSNLTIVSLMRLCFVDFVEGNAAAIFLVKKLDRGKLKDFVRVTQNQLECIERLALTKTISRIEADDAIRKIAELVDHVDSASQSSPNVVSTNAGEKRRLVMGLAFLFHDITGLMPTAARASQDRTTGQDSAFEDFVHATIAAFELDNIDKKTWESPIRNGLSDVSPHLPAQRFWWLPGAIKQAMKGTGQQITGI